MGAIQGAVNAAVGAVGAGVSVAKGLETAKKSLQEQMAEKARKAAQDEITFKLSQEMLKGQRLANRKTRLEIKQKKLELEGGKK